MRRFVWLAVLAGCGRLAFDPLPGTSDDGGPGDGIGIDEGTFNPTRTTYLKSPNTDNDDFFGVAAALSADGNWLVVGAFGEDGGSTTDGDMTNDGVADAGAAYVFERTGGTWVHRNYLKASNLDPGDSFGQRVAISADGSTIAVAAINEDSIVGNVLSNTADTAGAVYVYVRNGLSWRQQGLLKAGNAEAFDRFGASISLSGTGNTIVIGADGEDSVVGSPGDNSLGQSGAAYVFERTGDTWTQSEFLKASNADPADLFGASVRISTDGTRIVVGAPQESSNANGVNGDQTNDSLGNSGAAYVFVRTGQTWTQEAYVKASNPFGGTNFGWDVALSSAGDTLLVCSIGETSAAVGINGAQTTGAAFSAGAGYIFERTASWAQTTYVKATNTEATDELGFTCRLSDNAKIAVLSTQLEDGGDPANGADNSASNSGAAYVYGRTATSWEPRRYVKAPNLGMDDNFGVGVAINADASVLAVGASGEDGSGTGTDPADDDNGPDAGAVYILE